ncbi:MAG: hypothetical protein PHR77_17880 [Kiritimatiellae bacterium]|nr:hypothetical protein [Kiritimatiellia bacterium]MDD5522579.1 hypothetical protein [Kiritimatiellia bacterium]
MKKLFIVLLAVCIAGTGCGKKVSEKITEKMIEKSMEKDGMKADVKISDGKMTINAKDKDGKKSDINISGDKVTVNSTDGTATFAGGGSAKIPDNFPKDVYVYDGATVAAVVTVPEGCNMSLQTKDSSEKVIAAYKSKMGANGWKEEASYNTAQQVMISYKKDNKTANVITVSADGNTQINLTVIEEKK